MKIALIVGPFPRGQCGVGDYVDLLAESLNARGVDTDVVDAGDWRLFSLPKLQRTIQSKNYDLLQIHYPSLGFGSGLAPQIVSLLRRCVITLHEGSQSRLLRRLALIPFSIRPRHVIFFSKFERDFGLRWAPWISSISSVIPPPSNIRKVRYDGPRNLSEIVSFGLIRPGNGHDASIEFAALLKLSGLPLRLRIVGSLQSNKFIPYFEELRARSAGLPITWDHGLSEQEVAERLARASMAYLPYPDGAAELRSTLKAALLNGLAIITTRGAKTPADLENVVKFAENPRQAVEMCRFFLDTPEEMEILSLRAMSYVREWTWERTAELHEGIYRRLLAGSDSESKSRGTLFPPARTGFPG